MTSCGMTRRIRYTCAAGQKYSKRRLGAAEPALALAVAGAGALADDRPPTATPIKHVVVIFQENVSFDHYFGTYPNALNLSGETPFMASPRTPRVNNLVNPLDVNHNFRSLAGVD